MELKFIAVDPESKEGKSPTIWEPHVVKLCESAFEAVWDRAIPHQEYMIR